MSETFRFPNVRWADGTWKCGTEDAAILFKPNGRVGIRRGSKSVKAEWSSFAGRTGAVDEKFRSGAQLGPLVFELIHVHLLPELLTFIEAMLTEPDQAKYFKLSVRGLFGRSMPLGQ